MKGEPQPGEGKQGESRTGIGEAAESQPEARGKPDYGHAENRFRAGIKAHGGSHRKCAVQI